MSTTKSKQLHPEMFENLQREISRELKASEFEYQWLRQYTKSICFLPAYKNVFIEISADRENSSPVVCFVVLDHNGDQISRNKVQLANDTIAWRSFYRVMEDLL